MQTEGGRLDDNEPVAHTRTAATAAVAVAAVFAADRMLCIDSLASIHQRVLHLAVVDAGATVAFARSVRVLHATQAAISQ